MGRTDLLGDGIPVTAVYFAPDHIDSSQYVQYFGMIDGRVAWLGSRPLAAERRARPTLLAEALAVGGRRPGPTLYTQLGQR